MTTRRQPDRCACLAVSIALLGSYAVALPATATEARAEFTQNAAQTADEMARRLRTQYPTTRIDSVSASVVPGLFEVVMGKNVAYVEPTGRFFVFGHVWDMQKQRDTTADRRQSLDRVDVTALPTARALKAQYGNGSRVLHVLADPQCGYCKRLEASFAGLKDVTVYTYVLPILGPRSRDLATALLCSPQPSRAWQDWMLQGIEPPAPAAACDQGARIEEIERAAASLGVQATPTLIAGDGRKRAGALPVDQLLAWLDAASPAPVAQSQERPGAGPAPTRKSAAEAVTAEALGPKVNP